ncbi:MAG: integrase [Geobacteraceae bacterium GWC2_58_44]|nr:MAG: integrase [Geobacteraceae bacterium GWC2_58_44]HBG04683.1 integrase [Geobacter sp.]
MTDMTLVGPWVRRFLMEHLIGERNLTRNTQASYRDALVLMLPFAAAHVGLPIERLSLEHLSPELIRSFLLYLEQQRECSVATRNQRLAAIHAFAHFIGERSPEHLSWCSKIRAVPFKKTSRPIMSYLDKPEMDTLLDTPNSTTKQGMRDYALLLFLYNTGARADEAARVTVNDLNFDSSSSVSISGKRGKIRICPLWDLTANTLQSLIAGRKDGQQVFLNCRDQAITRFGVNAIVKRYVLKASKKVSSLSSKRVSTHTIRHTTAVHLLRAGVDINTIRAWLGHVSLDTTNIYAEVDLEMKAKALAHCEIFTPEESTKHWNDQPDLMAFLKAL